MSVFITIEIWCEFIIWYSTAFFFLLSEYNILNSLDIKTKSCDEVAIIVKVERLTIMLTKQHLVKYMNCLRDIIGYGFYFGIEKSYC